MKKILITIGCAVLCGCAHFQTTQEDQSYDKGQPTRNIVTHASAWTFFDAQSQLSKFRASQSDKTQTASVGSLNENSSGTNTVAIIQALSGLAATVVK